MTANLTLLSALCQSSALCDPRDGEESLSARGGEGAERVNMHTHLVEKQKLEASTTRKPLCHTMTQVFSPKMTEVLKCCEIILKLHVKHRENEQNRGRTRKQMCSLGERQQLQLYCSVSSCLEWILIRTSVASQFSLRVCCGNPVWKITVSVFHRRKGVENVIYSVEVNGSSLYWYKITLKSCEKGNFWNIYSIFCLKFEYVFS